MMWPVITLLVALFSWWIGIIIGYLLACKDHKWRDI